MDAIGRFLIDRNLSDEFNPHGRAPKTSGLLKMRDANLSDDRIAVEEAIEDYGCEIVNDKVIDVTYLNSCVLMEGKDLPVQRALANVLRDMGYEKIEKGRIKIGKDYHYIWTRVSSEDAKKTVRDWHVGKGDFSDVPF